VANDVGARGLTSRGKTPGPTATSTTGSDAVRDWCKPRETSRTVPGFSGGAEGASPPGARPGTREAGRARETDPEASGCVEAAGRADVVSLDQKRAGRALEEAAEPRPAAGLDVIAQTVRSAVRDANAPVLARLEELVAAADEVLTMDGVEAVLRVSGKTVLKWIRKRGLPASRVGKEWRFRRSAVVRWMGEQRHVQ